MRINIGLRKVSISHDCYVSTGYTLLCGIQLYQIEFFIYFCRLNDSRLLELTPLEIIKIIFIETHFFLSI